MHLAEKHFLWPNSPGFKALGSIRRPVSTEEVERVLIDKFPTGYPVLCSSGRAAIVLALLDSSLSRENQVDVFPFASHCVLDAVARVAMPVAHMGSDIGDLKLIYHQWGFVQESNIPANSIEDSADTLCAEGAELFPAGGKYEIWSLPKILGTSSGGVLWCRDEESALRTRKLRDSSGSGMMPWLLRLLGTKNSFLHYCWQGVEGYRFNISKIQNGEILHALLNLDALVRDRKSKLDLLLPRSEEWRAALKDKRFPSNVPLSVDIEPELAIELGVLAAIRHIEKIDSFGNKELKDVLPIPIHQDVSVRWIKQTIDAIFGQ